MNPLATRSYRQSGPYCLLCISVQMMRHPPPSPRSMRAALYLREFCETRPRSLFFSPSPEPARILSCPLMVGPSVRLRCEKSQSILERKKHAIMAEGGRGLRQTAGRPPSPSLCLLWFGQRFRNSRGLDSQTSQVKGTPAIANPKGPKVVD